MKLNPSRHVTVISAYAPTLTSSDEAKDAFYEELHTLVKDVPLQQLERRTRTSWHREAKLKWPHVVEFLC